MSTERFQVNSPSLQLPGLLNTTSLQLLQAETPSVDAGLGRGVLTFNKQINRGSTTVTGLYTPNVLVSGQQAVGQIALPILGGSDLTDRQVRINYTPIFALGQPQAIRINALATDGSRLNVNISVATLFE